MSTLTDKAGTSDKHVEAAFRVVSCAELGTVNAYQERFYDALASVGVQLSGEGQVNDAWIRTHSAGLDAIHLHWPESLWRRGRSWQGQLRAVAGVWRYLRLAKQLGLKRIWTVHNLEHHEGSGWIDRLGYRTLAKNTDLLICHSQWAASELRRRDRPRGRVVVMPHGNYDGVYPEPDTSARILQKLNLDLSKPTVCLVGTLRSYKGVEVALEAARELGREVQFVLAGRFRSAEDAQWTRRAVADLPGVRLIDRMISDQEFADLVTASEAVLLPYRKITGSGVLLAAWTLKRGVVASDLPYFREMAAPEPDSATFFKPGDPIALSERIREYLSRSPSSRAEAARRLADLYRWEDCVQPVAEVIAEWINRRKRADIRNGNASRS